jgi:hypothetical protein
MQTNNTLTLSLVRGCHLSLHVLFSIKPLPKSLLDNTDTDTASTPQLNTEYTFMNAFTFPIGSTSATLFSSSYRSDLGAYDVPEAYAYSGDLH